MLVPTGKLHLQTHIAIAFSYDILCTLQAQSTTQQTTSLATTKDASFYVKSILKVTVCMLRSPWLHCCLVNCAQVHVYKAANLYVGLHYIRNDQLHYQWCIFSMSRNQLWLLICFPVCQSIRRVAPVTSVWCMHAKWTRKISYTSNLLESTYRKSLNKSWGAYFLSKVFKKASI